MSGCFECFYTLSPNFLDPEVDPDAAAGAEETVAKPQQMADGSSSRDTP
jgi:hypothetical protein